MASRTFRSSINQRAPWTYRLTRDEEKDQHFLFTFDEKWFEAYGAFVDALQRIVDRHRLPEDDFDAMKVLCSPSYIIDVLLREELNDMTLTEHMIDEAHELFGEAVAADVLEELTNFINSTHRPNGYGQILEILKRNQSSDDCWFSLSDFQPYREDDTQVFSITFYA